MKNPDIILVHFSSQPGGIEVILPEMIEHLSQFSFSAFILRPDSPGQPSVYKNSGIDIKYGSLNNVAAGLKLFLYAFRNNSSIFHVFNIGPVFLLILRIAGVKSLVYSIHGTQYWKNRIEKNVLSFFWKIALSRKFLITSNTVYSGKVFSDQVHQRNDITLLYNPIDGELFTPSNKKVRVSALQKIVYCGRLDKGKNLDEWIRVASKILKQFPEVIFEIYGDGPDYKRIQGFITELKLNDHISLKGYTAEPETAFQEADAMIFLSRYESFGNVAVECILCGTPVIAGDIPSMKEIFCDFPDFLVSLDENTADAIILKLRDLEHLNKMAFLARLNFRERFSPLTHYKKLKDLYSTLQ